MRLRPLLALVCVGAFSWLLTTGCELEPFNADAGYKCSDDRDCLTDFRCQDGTCVRRPITDGGEKTASESAGEKTGERNKEANKESAPTDGGESSSQEKPPEPRSSQEKPPEPRSSPETTNEPTPD